MPLFIIILCCGTRLMSTVRGSADAYLGLDYGILFGMYDVAYRALCPTGCCCFLSTSLFLGWLFPDWLRCIRCQNSLVPCDHRAHMLLYQNTMTATHKLSVLNLVHLSIVRPLFSYKNIALILSQYADFCNFLFLRLLHKKTICVL